MPARKNPFKAALKEKAYLTRYFYDEVQKLGFEVGPNPSLSVTTYRYAPADMSLEAANELNKKLVELIRLDGRVFLTSTTLDGVYWIRVAVLSFRTHLYHMDVTLELLEKGIAL